ncbi:MAG TPA: GxxExxY protein [Gemmatimonadaceae bacterium]|nr:GxxExxY protein [Gemmatimonadaceae bacterium]
MPKDELIEERLTESIIGAFYEVYNRLGYGFFETAYTKALMIELGYRGHEAKREVKVDLYYRGFHLGRQRVDLIVDEKVIIEVKACDEMPRVALRQCLSYLRTTGIQVGLVLNFGAEPQIKRVVSRGAPLGPNTEVVFPVEAGPDPGPDGGLDLDDDATGSPA